MPYLQKYNYESFYNEALNKPNFKAFLLVIRNKESSIGPTAYTSLTGGGHFTPSPDYLFPTWDGINTAFGKSHAAGAYQFQPDSFKAKKMYSASTAYFIKSLPNFNPTNQDIAALINIWDYTGWDEINDGDIIGACKKLNRQWTSLPGGKQNPKGWTICDVLKFYTDHGGTLNKDNTAKFGTCPALTMENSDGSTDGVVASITTQQQLKANINAIQNNIDVLETDETTSGWGARQNTIEQSDWIGLRQYLLYLSTTFEPESIVPFVELIPKFLLGDPTDGNQVTKENTGDINDAQEIQKNKFLKSVEKFNTLQKNGYGGNAIDLMSNDPFKDMLISNEQSTKDSNPSGNAARNLGYRLYGAVVLNPGLQADQTSKSGGVGFKSFEIKHGEQVLTGMTTMSIKLLDVYGNKFLDPTSPWSFILNSHQIMGDFYFRYGWQIRVPNLDRQESDTNSTSYKYWNHPGWNLFSTNKVGLDKLKDNIFGMAQQSDNILTLTQSPNLSSINYPGYVIEKDATGVTTFAVDRRQLDPDNYLIMSMISPELSVDPTTGAITANILFKMNTALDSCLAGITDAQNIIGLINSKPKKGINLYSLMIAFLKDNLNSVPENSQARLKKMIDYTQPEDIQSWLDVKTCVQVGRDLDTIHPTEVPIIISRKKLEELFRKNKGESTMSTRQWIFEVCSENRIDMVSAGDPSIGTAQLTSKFVFIYDNTDVADIKTLTIRPNSGAAYNSATGFAGASELGRLILQDDVFSFRFRGSLVESINIESNGNPSAQQTENLITFAGGILSRTEIQNSQGGKDDNDAEKQKKKYDDLNTDVTKTLSKDVDRVKLEDKKRNLGYILTKMSGATIKCIAHPWLKMGVSIYIKGTGNFDGKYLITKLVHDLETGNKFTTTISAVRVVNDIDYANLQKQYQEDAKFAQNNPAAQVAQKVLGVSPSQFRNIKLGIFNTPNSNNTSQANILRFISNGSFNGI